MKKRNVTEHRRYKRYLIRRRVMVIASNSNEVVHALSRDISARGICLIVKGALPPSELYKISLTLGSTKHKGDGDAYVEFSARVSYGVDLPVNKRYGLEIVSITPRHQEALSAYLEMKKGETAKAAVSGAS